MKCPNENCRKGWISVPTEINGVPIVGQMKCTDPVHAPKPELVQSKPKKAAKTDQYSAEGWWER